MRKTFYHLILLGFVGACSTTPVDRDFPSDGEGGSAQTDVPRTSEAVVALLDIADRETDAGNHEPAAVSIERALRLEPKNALLWHRLGEIRLKQGDWRQALTLARKSNSLAAGNHSLQAANWRLIAAAKQAMGDEKGAKEAAQIVEKLNRQADE